MSNPARYHRAFVAAQLAASQDESAQMSHLGHYELLLFKLKQDLDRLHHVESRRRKAQLKRGMLPTYQPWVAGVLASGTGAQDAVLMRMLVWLLDVGDIAAALDIGDYALRHGLLAPDGFERATPCLIAEEVTASAQRNLNDGQPLDTEQLLRARQMLAGQDMPDKVKARLLKVVGLALRQDGEDEQALDCFRQALAQDETCGVKTEIKQLEKQLASSH